MLLGSHRGVREQVGKANDGIHWRANFMAHHRQEVALGAVRSFRPLLCFLELGRAFLYADFKMVTCLAQFLLCFPCGSASRETAARSHRPKKATPNTVIMIRGQFHKIGAHFIRVLILRQGDLFLIF